jgi:hypothetical protein
MFINGKQKYFDEMTESEISQFNLKRRLETYKANKRKAEAQATDYITDINTINNEFNTLKTEIISRLTNAETYEEYEVISKVTNYKLSFIVRDITRFKNYAINKEFTSVRQAQDSINNIKSAIAQLWEQLNK